MCLIIYKLPSRKNGQKGVITQKGLSDKEVLAFLENWIFWPKIASMTHAIMGHIVYSSEILTAVDGGAPHSTSNKIC